MKTKLTALEQKVFDQIKDHRIAFIRRHMGQNGSACYRALDKNISPLFNLDKKPVDKLIEKGYLEIDQTIYSGKFKILA